VGLSVIVAPLDGTSAYRAYNAAAATAAEPVFLFHTAGVTVDPESVERLSAALTDGVGIVTATIADSVNRVRSAGLGIARTRMSRFAIDVIARRAGEAFDERAPSEDVSAAPGTCMMITRSLFVELGGFAERYGDALADIDLSLRVRARGMRVVCVRGALAAARAAEIDCNDPRRMLSARARLDEDWRARIGAFAVARDPDVRETRVAPERYLDVPAAPRPITVFVHGDVADPAGLRDALERCGAPVAHMVWNSPSDPPQLGVPLEIDRSGTTYAARKAMELRGEQAIAFVDASFPLKEGWLAALRGELAWGGDVVAATFADASGDHVVPSCDARASLLALAEIPQHLRLDERVGLDAALIDLTARLRACGLAIRAADATRFAPQIERGRDVLSVRREAPVARADGLVSIVMLSWNAPNYTKIALESIRAHTPHPHEIIIVDNGSGPETTDWLRTLDDVTVIFNPSNRGFAGGNNQGIHAARGDYIVVLNNDVVVTEGWLDDLIDALRRNPLTGVSAPRSNRVAGSQMIADADYPDVATMHRFAAARRARWRKSGFYVDRAIGFCLCIDRRVIDEIGGIDERFGAGNFEDDDFCIRVRAAGYKIYVCDDVFIHHFGSVTFSANNVDWQASMNENWAKFARKWGLPDQYPTNGYLPQPVIARGFDRTTHFVPLSSTETVTSSEGAAATGTPRKDARARFAALVRDESDWSTVGAFVRRFAQAFGSDADVTLEIAACGAIDAATLGERVRRLLERSGLEVERVAEIGIDDVADVDRWLSELRPATLVRLQPGAFGGMFDAIELIKETSPSALRRTLARLGSGS